MAEGGEALLCAAACLDGVTDAEVEATFDRDRDTEYDETAAATRLARGAALFDGLYAVRSGGGRV